MQGGANSSEFRIPDSELEGSLELRVPGQQLSRLTPVPADKILFPRRMLYVEAVLYLTVAATAFGLGYLTGHRGLSVANKEDAVVQMRVPVEGKVLLNQRAGTKRGDEGAVVIALPASKTPNKRLPIAGLRPSDAPTTGNDVASGSLAEFGGATTQADAAGNFALFVPVAGSYRILIISRQATRGPDGPLEQSDISELGKYFDSPTELLRRCRYRWLTKDLRLGTKPIEVEFTE